MCRKFVAYYRVSTDKQGRSGEGFWQEGESLFFRQALLEGIFRITRNRTAIPRVSDPREPG
jgi:hypothetical protein